MEGEGQFYRGVYFAESYKDIPYLVNSKSDPERVSWLEGLEKFIRKINDGAFKESEDIKVLVLYRQELDMCLCSIVIDDIEVSEDIISNGLEGFKWCTRYGLTFLLPLMKMRKAQGMYSSGDVVFAGFKIKLSTNKAKDTNMGNAASALLGG